MKCHWVSAALSGSGCQIRERASSMSLTQFTPRKCNCGRQPAHRTRKRDAQGIPMCDVAILSAGPQRDVGLEEGLRGTGGRNERRGLSPPEVKLERNESSTSAMLSQICARAQLMGISFVLSSLSSTVLKYLSDKVVKSKRHVRATLSLAGSRLWKDVGIRSRNEVRTEK